MTEEYIKFLEPLKCVRLGQTPPFALPVISVWFYDVKSFTNNIENWADVSPQNGKVLFWTTTPKKENRNNADKEGGGGRRVAVANTLRPFFRFY